MATVDMAGGSSTATPTQTGRNNVMVIDRVVDFAKATEHKGSALAANDVIEALNVPAGCYVLAGGAEVEKAEATASACTVDIGFNDDSLVDGGDVTAAGFLASGTNGSAQLDTTGAFKSSADTVDVKIASATGTPSDAKVRVYVIVADANGV